MANNHEQFMDEHYVYARKITLWLYLISGAFVLPCCILSDNIGIFMTVAAEIFWIITLAVLFFVAKGIIIYGPVLLVSVAVLSGFMCVATDSIYSMMSIFLVQWLGAIFFMEPKIIPITTSIQFLSILFMLLYPFTSAPNVLEIRSAVFSGIAVLIAAFFCDKLVNLLCKEVNTNKKHVEHLKKVTGDLDAALAKAGQALNAKSEFLASMSHEIRTPLNSIHGEAVTALRVCKQDDVYECLNNILFSCSNLHATINDVLDFSKIESGNIELNEEPYDFRDILNGLVRTHSIKAKEKNIEFVLSVAPDVPAVMSGDTVRIIQIYSNLLSNAIKYTENGSVKVTIWANRLSSAKTMLNYSVEDTGIGIRQEDMGKLFDTFRRLDMSRNCSVEGTGLGLALVKKLTEAMDGEVSVESEYNKGSKFTVSIPQIIASDSKIGTYSAENVNSEVKKTNYRVPFTAPDAKILIVDDYQPNLRVAANLLAFTNMQIETCSSGRECLQLASKTRYDIILLDHRMPEMDGIETLKRLKMMVDSPCFDTPIIALTANVGKDSRTEYIDYGFTDYLAKPIEPEEYEQLMLKYLPPELLKITGNTAIDDESKSGPAEEGKAADIIDEPSDSGPLIDRVTGEKYCGGSDMFAMILDAIISESEKEINTLDTSLKTSDLDTYLIKIHSLKSTAKTIGSTVLSDKAKELEQFAKAGDIASIAAGHGDCMALYREVIEEAKTLLK